MAERQRDVELVSVIGPARGGVGTASASAAGAPGLMRRAIGTLLAILGLALVAFWAYVGYCAITPPTLEISLADGSQGLPPNAVIRVTASGLSLSPVNVTLRELHLDAAGQIDAERSVPVRMDGAGLGWLYVERSGRLVLADDGTPLTADARYELAVSAAARHLTRDGLNVVTLTRRVEFTTVVSAQPLPLDQQVELRRGDDVTVRWNTPLREVAYAVSPPVGTTAWIDEQNPRVSHIRFTEYEQGQRYTIALTKAVSQEGSVWPQSRTLSVVTATPLAVVAESPENGAEDVDRRIQPEIVFSEAVANRDALLGSVRIEPEIAGRFQWPEPNRLQFVPEDPLPAPRELAISVPGGPDGLRAGGGGYLPDDHVLRFGTQLHKLIDVSLSRQIVTLYEDDRLVWSAPTATGVRGAETPPGRYTVQYKVPTARFRGTNPDGSRYDIPDVPWVLAFMGDYTIHGAYWRSTFGRPGSNGCVSLTPSNARYIYEWAPVGTPIVIHY